MKVLMATPSGGRSLRGQTRAVVVQKLPILDSMSTKIAVITGSSSGIGLLTAIELAKNGFRVVASMRDLGRRGRLDEAAAAAGVADKIELRRLDVTEFSNIGRFADDVTR